MAYKYRVYTGDKRIVQGMIDVTSEGMAEEALYHQGYQRILSLEEARPKQSWGELIPSLFGIKAQDVLDFYKQLANLIESGIPLLMALHLLEGLASRAAFKKVIAGLAEELQAGNPLSQALGKYPQVFSDTHCQVIKASEQAGNLEAGLRQVASYVEKRSTTRQKIMRALAYPAVVLLMAIAVATLLVTVALPPLVELFNSLGAQLPWMTGLLIAVANFLINYKLYLLGGLVTLVILIVGYVRSPAGRLTVDRLMLRVPVIGQLTIERNLGQFCQSVSMMLKVGLRLPQVMDIVIQTVGNRVIRQALKEVQERLVQGQGLSQPMAGIELFPRLLVEMVVVGEKTGTLDSNLATLGDFYEQRVDQRINALIAMIEPVLTVIIGLTVVFIALSMITPLYSVLRSMH
jgi:type IV pilus assembly protein PilC